MKLFLLYRSFTCTPPLCMQLHAACYTQQSAVTRNNVLQAAICSHTLSHAAPPSHSKYICLREKKSMLPAGFEPATHRNFWNLTAMLLTIRLWEHLICLHKQKQIYVKESMRTKPRWKIVPLSIMINILS